MGGWSRGINNWTPWITQNVLIALFSREDLTAHQQRLILYQAAKSLDYFLDEYGEDGDDFLTIDKKDGWAALAFNTWDEDGIAHLYQPVAQDDHTQEQAPVFIGGQTPVLKRNALYDVQTIVDCILYFAKTGKPDPNLEWEEAEFC